MSARQEIAAAASSGDLDVAEYYRQSPKAGTGFVRLSDKNRAANGFGYVDTWDVVVCLPQDIVQAEKYIEQIQGPLLAALEPVMAVQSLTPTSIAFDTGTVPGFVITGAREG